MAVKKQTPVDAEKNYCVYILKCANGNYYTGITTDLTRRFAEHKAGTDKCKYTRSFKPLHIAQHWQVNGDKSFALKIERYIKKLSKAQKLFLINNPKELNTCSV